uniref:Salivary secreted protein n=1 Tax=Triatoma infestans TaxID=30076 RepID=A6YPN0_TRIIF|nr:salivary secreted protein [Triatoma infestans]
MKHSITIVFSLGLLHYAAHGAPNIFGSFLTSAAEYVSGKINKTAEAVGQVISLVNGTAQLGTSLTGSAAYMGTSTAKAGLSSVASLGNEVVSGVVNVADKGLGFVSNLSEKIPVVGVPIKEVAGVGRVTIDLLPSVTKDVLNLTESIGKGALTATNTAAQLTTGTVGAATHGGAAGGKYAVQAAADLITGAITRTPET